MRTTVSIPDELLAAAKRRAGERGQTLGQIVEAALQRELSSDTIKGSKRPPVPVFTSGTGPRPGLDLSSSRTLHEALDEGVGLDRRR